MNTYLNVPPKESRRYPLIYVEEIGGASRGFMDVDSTWAFVFIQHADHEGVRREKIFNGRDAHDILEQVQFFVEQLAASYSTKEREKY